MPIATHNNSMIKMFICAVAISSVFNIVAVVTEVPGVRQAVAYQLENGEVIVATLTEPIFSLSERAGLIQAIKTAVYQKTGSEVYVSLDTDMFVAISKCSNEKMALELKNIIMKRNR